MQKRFYSFLLTIILILGSFISASQRSLAATSTGDGTAESPYLIKTVDDLYKIPEDPTAHYKIVNDLDYNYATRQPMAEFQGVLDGGGHTIRNLIIVSHSDDVGLFSRMKESTIKNLHITNSNVYSASKSTGTFTGYCLNTNYINCSVTNSQIIGTSSYVGGIVGNGFDSTFKNCYSINNNVKGSSYVGGISGYISKGTLLQCYSTSTVEGTGTGISGLIGYVITNVNIQECFTSGDIKGLINGGLIGQSAHAVPTIENSYSICNLLSYNSNTYAGGLIGYIHNSNYDYQPTIRRSYFSGELAGMTRVGLSPSGTVVDSYFDKTITDISSPTTQARATEEMYQMANYINWDFDTIWDIENGKGYPTLKFMTGEPEIPNPDITATMVVIEKSEQLQLAVTEDLLENYDLDWTSSDEAVASIDNTGFVTAHALGETLITAKSKYEEYEESIYVMVVENASQYRMTVELKTGASCKVRIRGVDNSSITWNSMDGLTASVTEKGKVKAISKGLTVLTAVAADGKEVGQVYIRVR